MNQSRGGSGTAIVFLVLAIGIGAVTQRYWKPAFANSKPDASIAMPERPVVTPLDILPDDTDALLIDDVSSPVAGVQIRPEANAINDTNEARDAFKRAFNLTGDEKLKALKECYATYPDSPSGIDSARTCGDIMYEIASASTGMKQDEALNEAYEAYSVAIMGIRDRRMTADILERLDDLSGRLAFSPTTLPRSPKGTIYNVASGDSLWSIAKKHKTTHSMIRRFNGLGEEASIRPGQRLKILSPETVKIIVSTTEHHLTLFYDGRYIRRFNVGLGKNDSTPLGVYKVSDKVDYPDWYYNGERIPYGDKRNILGTRWLGFDMVCAGARIGIHGTRNRDGIGGNESMGCVRLVNDDVELLYDLTPIGATVVIQR